MKPLLSDCAASRLVQRAGAIEVRIWRLCLEFLVQMTGDGVREPPGFRRQPRWRSMMILSRVCSCDIGDEAEKRPRPWDATMKVGIATSMRGAD